MKIILSKSQMDEEKEKSSLCYDCSAKPLIDVGCIDKSYCNDCEALELRKIRIENVLLKNNIKKMDGIIEEVIKYLDRELKRIEDHKMEIDAFKTALRISVYSIK